MCYFFQSQVLIVQKLLRGSQITALRLQGVPVMGDNPQPRMNLPSLLHRTAPIFRQMALHGYDRGSRRELEEEVLPLFIQKSFGPKHLFLWLLAILDQKILTGWSKIEGCSPNFSPLNLLCMQYDTVWYSFHLYRTWVSFNRLLKVPDGWYLKNDQLFKIFFSMLICDPMPYYTLHALQSLFWRGNCYFLYMS